MSDFLLLGIYVAGFVVTATITSAMTQMANRGSGYVKYDRMETGVCAVFSGMLWPFMIVLLAGMGLMYFIGWAAERAANRGR